MFPYRPLVNPLSSQSLNLSHRAAGCPPCLQYTHSEPPHVSLWCACAGGSQISETTPICLLDTRPSWPAALCISLRNLRLTIFKTNFCFLLSKPKLSFPILANKPGCELEGKKGIEDDSKAFSLSNLVSAHVAGE